MAERYDQRAEEELLRRAYFESIYPNWALMPSEEKTKAEQELAETNRIRKEKGFEPLEYAVQGDLPLDAEKNREKRGRTSSVTGVLH
jgi:hypothetical protein